MEEKQSKKNLLAKLFWLNSLLIIAELGAILLEKNILPTLVPLFYSRPWGKEQLASPNNLFIIPLSSFLLLLFNLAVGKLLQKKGEEFLALVINTGSLLFSLLGAITILRIIFLVT